MAFSSNSAGFRKSLSFLLFLGILLTVPVAPAGEPVLAPNPEYPSLVEERPSILDERPCGPDCVKGPLRYLFFQGCAGADFRPACVGHDACYDRIDSDKDACVRCFLEEMLAECENSKHPRNARFRAKMAYLAVKFFGKGAWEDAQILSLRQVGRFLTQ